MIKKLTLAVTAAAAVVAVAFAAPSLARDAQKKPSHKAVDDIRSQLVAPSSADPNSIAGVIDPAKEKGAVLFLRDPDTGNVQRDPKTGLPAVATDDQGKIKLFKPNDVPDDQKRASTKHQQVVDAANAGDASAKATLADDVAKTKDAVAKHPNGK